MDIKEYFNQKRVLYDLLLNFLENDDEDENEYKELIRYIESNCLGSDRCEFQILLRLIVKISKHHHRTPIFRKKVEQIILHFSNEIKQTFSNSEIFNIFINDKQTLLLLFKHDIMTMNHRLLTNIFKKLSNDKFDYSQFFFPEIKPQLEETKGKNEEEEEEFKEEEEEEEYDDEEEGMTSIKKIKKELLNFDSEIFEKFDEKRKTGENDSYICQLIRNDSVVEFIAYVNKKIIPLSSKVKPSLFETNPFLTKNEVTLIEYAAFFGSIQIFQFLRLSNVEMNQILWFCAVHSNNAELFHLIEENLPKPHPQLIEELLIESIKCHHNGIANYIINNFYQTDENENEFGESLTAYCLRFYNYSLLPDEFVDDKYLFFYMCEYNYYTIVDYLLKNEKIDINSTVSFTIQNKTGYLIEQKESNYPPLYFAAKNNSQEALNILLNQPEIVVKPGIFQYCTKLEKIKIPSFLTKISEFAFAFCYSLAEVIIPSSVKVIEKNAFMSCMSLFHIVIPSSVTEIGDCAFNDCTYLEEIEIPSSVTKIGASAFDGCISLSKITILSKLDVISKLLFQKCFSLEKIEIPSSVTKIDEYAFSKCKYLIEIELPDSVTEIKVGSFGFCKSLEKIKIPSSVKKIEDITFIECTNLRSILIPPSVISIGNEVFEGCSSLEQVEIPSSVTSIGDSVFKYCYALEHVEIPSSVTSIGDSVFEGCFSLENIEISSSVTSIGHFVFKGCSSLVHIVIPPSVISLGNSVFEDCSSLVHIEIPPSVTSIGNSAFINCRSLIEFIIPKSVTSIRNYCFKGCSSLVNISIHSSVVSIGREAFCDCISLEEIVIPSSVKSIKKDILKGCKNLKQVTIPSFVQANIIGISSNVKIINTK